MHRHRSLAIGALLFVPTALFLLAPAICATRTHRVAASADASNQTEVKGLYGKFCLQCHGADGRANDMKAIMPTIPDFTNRDWQQGVSDAQLKVSILEGKGALMPALNDRLNDEQARGLTVMVREFAAPVTPK